MKKRPRKYINKKQYYCKSECNGVCERAVRLSEQSVREYMDARTENMTRLTLQLQRQNQKIQCIERQYFIVYKNFR